MKRGACHIAMRQKLVIGCSWGYLVECLYVGERIRHAWHIWCTCPRHERMPLCMSPWVTHIQAKMACVQRFAHSRLGTALIDDAM